MPKIEAETGVVIRLLVGLRRVPLTILRDQKTASNYLRENLDVLKAVARSPYVVGSDFIGEEINDISDLKPVINESSAMYEIKDDKKAIEDLINSYKKENVLGLWENVIDN